MDRYRLEAEIDVYKQIMRRVEHRHDKIYAVLSSINRENAIVQLGGIEKAERKLLDLINKENGLEECPKCKGEGRMISGYSHDCWGSQETNYLLCQRCEGTGLVNKQKEKEERKTRYLALKGEFENVS